MDPPHEDHHKVTTDVVASLLDSLGMQIYGNVTLDHCIQGLPPINLTVLVAVKLLYWVSLVRWFSGGEGCGIFRRPTW